MKTLSMKEWVDTGCAEYIFTATRGPDDVDWLLKCYTTSRIRSFIVDWGYGEVNRQPLTVAEQAERNGCLRRSSVHFQQHYYKAVDAIRNRCGYDLIEEKEVTTNGIYGNKEEAN